MADLPLGLSGGRRRFVEVGRVSHRPGITVTKWAPEQTEPERLRAYLRRQHGASTNLNDESLQAVIDGAKDWIAGRRLSWIAVAANYLADGKFHV